MNPLSQALLLALLGFSFIASLAALAIYVHVLAAVLAFCAIVVAVVVFCED